MNITPKTYNLYNKKYTYIYAVGKFNGSGAIITIYLLIIKSIDVLFN